MTPPTPTLPRPKGCICGKANCKIPYGKCHCGCLRDTPIAFETISRRFLYAGMPARYFYGHSYKTQKTPDIPRDAKPFKINGKPCRLVPLTKGLYAIVDDSQYKKVMTREWSALWSKNGRRYYATSRDGRKTIYMHRFILGLDYGDPRDGDHIETMATLDNRQDNLQIVSQAENTRRSKKQLRRKDGLKGAHKHRNQWHSHITENRKSFYLGSFKTELEAHIRYCEEAKKRFGRFASFG